MRAGSLATTRKLSPRNSVPRGNLNLTASVNSQLERSAVVFARLNSSMNSGVPEDLGGSNMTSLITTSRLRGAAFGPLCVAVGVQYHSSPPFGNASNVPAPLRGVNVRESRTLF